LIHAGSDAERVLDLLPRVEPDPPVVPPPATPAPNSSLEPAILRRLERLLAGQEALKRGQYAIYRRLTASERHQVAELREALVGVQGNRVALRDLQQITDGLRRALRDIRDRQLGSLETDVHEVLQEVTEILGADVGVTTELELLIPFLPFLLKVDLGGSIDIRELVEQLIARLRGQRGRQGSREP
jgi:hypothetical protein